MTSTAAPHPLRILFVCSGNICRSPMAEAIFRSLADNAGVGPRFKVDSAGTHGYHEGDQADPRTRKVAERHGIRVTSIARTVEDEDFDRFDLLIAMDRGHKRELLARGGSRSAQKIRLVREFDPGADSLDVPDPYYDGTFERVFDILDSACRGLFAALKA
jgi:protein-tyrosine phosphatase